MTNPLDQLNLRPQEKRILVVVAFLIFVALNFWLVTPLFGQRGKANSELEQSRRTLAKYQDEIAKAPNLQRMEAELKKAGGDVLTAELQLQRLVSDQATAEGVMVTRYAPGVRTSTGRTNQFFEDQGLTIDFSSASTNLVDFMVKMASGNSMVRVQDMNLRPDPSGTRLMGNILFVASYQKKTPTSATPLASGSAPRKAVTNKTAAATAPKTNTTAKAGPGATKTPTNMTTRAATNKPPAVKR